MTTAAPAGFVDALRALPRGSFRGHYNGRGYLVTKTFFGGGRSFKLVAEELGGTDYISLNLYLLDSGPRLFPCEMPSQKVIDFVAGIVPDQVAG